jgi:tripartite-type tricarboxylate transporter receptor subunit TctC
MAMLPLVAMPLPAFAQAYPSKPVRLIVPFPAGGVLDRLSRSIAPRAAETFGQPVLVENRPGASTILGTEAVARTEPDGHTMRLAAATSFTVLPSLSYDLNANFEIAAGIADTIAIMEMKEG